MVLNLSVHIWFLLSRSANPFVFFVLYGRTPPQKIMDWGIKIPFLLPLDNIRHHPRDHQDHHMIGQVLHQLVSQLLSERETVWRKVKC